MGGVLAMDNGWNVALFFLCVQPDGKIEVDESMVYNCDCMPPISGQVSFGAFELDLESGELRKSGSILKLQRSPYAFCASWSVRQASWSAVRTSGVAYGASLHSWTMTSVWIIV